MKKKQTANVVMLLIAAVIAAAGVFTALHLRAQNENALGGQYKITRIPNDRLALQEETGKQCTITIRCDTVLDNPDSLDKEKVPYIPADGTILPVTTVAFSEGETVFDILRRVCTAADIPLEYSWTPMYDSYYVEGINHLYEFDCGPESGWMFEVNGSFPNYGCSAFALKGGEEIVWRYTCAGLGEDVGDTRIQE